MGTHLFISYAWIDRDYVGTLAAQLREAGLNPWMFEHDQMPSVSFLDQLIAVIADAQAVLVVLTPASMSSTAVTQEVLYAIEKRRTILPLLREEGEGRVSFLLRPFHWVDARSEPFPIAQIAEALGMAAGVQFPMLRLKALPSFADLVSPPEITLKTPPYAWSRLLEEPGYEVQLGSIGTLPDRSMVVSLDLPTISRCHAHVSLRRSPEGRWVYLLYNTSRNGTWVNGQRVPQSDCCELAHDALIGLAGDALLIQVSLFERTTLDVSPYLG